jgi:hypothetical protein
VEAGLYDCSTHVPEERSIWPLAGVSTIYSRFANAAERVAACVGRTFCSPHHLACDLYTLSRLESVCHASLQHAIGSNLSMRLCALPFLNHRITALKQHTSLRVQLTSTTLSILSQTCTTNPNAQSSSSPTQTPKYMRSHSTPPYTHAGRADF